MTDPAAAVIAALEAGQFDPRSKGTDRWESRCPVHKGSRRNLSIKRTAEGGCLLYCHHADEEGRGCDPGEIAAALGMSLADLGPPVRVEEAKAKVEADRKGKGRGFPTAREAAKFLAGKLGCSSAKSWVYRDNSGAAILVVYRFDTPEGKTYRPVHRTPEGWRFGDPPGPLPLYGLPELAGAGRIYLTEGEKAAEAARALDVLATTSAHGAKSPGRTNFSALAGRDVVILPDADAPGEGYARAVVGLLAKLNPAPTVRVVRLPGLSEGGDVVEWIEACPEAWGTAEIRAELERLADSAPVEDLSQAAGPAGSTDERADARTGSTPPSCWLTVAPETVLMAHDVDPPNVGRVVQDLGDRVQMHFVSPSGREATKAIPKAQLTFPDGRSLKAEVDPDDREWPPLRIGAMPDTEPFPLDTFPEAIAGFARTAADAIGCPPDFLGLSILIVAGAAIGRSASLLLKPGYFAPAALYGLNVGGPSSGKSPALEIVVKALLVIDEQLHDAFRLELLAYDGQVEAYAVSPKGEKPPKPRKPVLRSAVLEDCTVEAVAPHLAQNPRGLLVSRDEGSAWVASLDQYKKGGKGSDRQFWLAALFGKAIRVDRKSHAEMEPIRVPNPFLAVVGNLPSEMLSALSEGRGRSDGFIERILFAYPDPKPRPYWNDAGIPDEARSEWAEVIRKLRARPMAEADGKSHPHVVHFTPEAKAAWVAWYNAHVDEVNDPAYDSGLLAAEGKLCDFAARLALILHLLRLATDPTGEDAGPIPPLPPSIVSGAVRLWSYFRAQHRRVRASLGGKGTGDAPPASG